MGVDGDTDLGEFVADELEGFVNDCGVRMKNADVIHVAVEDKTREFVLQLLKDGIHDSTEEERTEGRTLSNTFGTFDDMGAVSCG